MLRAGSLFIIIGLLMLVLSLLMEITFGSAFGMILFFVGYHRYSTKRIVMEVLEDVY